MYNSNEDNKKFNLDGDLSLLRNNDGEKKEIVFDKAKEKKLGAYRFFKRDATIAIFIFALLEAAYSIDDIIEELMIGFSGPPFARIVQGLMLIIRIVSTFGLLFVMINITSGAKRLDFDKFTRGFKSLTALFYIYIISAIIFSLNNISEIFIHHDQGVTIVSILIVLGRLFSIWFILRPAIKFFKDFLNAFHAKDITYPTRIPFKTAFVVYLVYFLITSIAFSVVYTRVLLEDSTMQGLVMGILILTFALVAIIYLLLYNYMNSYEKHFSFFNRNLEKKEEEAKYNVDDEYVARLKDPTEEDIWRLK